MNSTNSSKRVILYNVLFLISFVITVIVSATMEREYLIYACPVVIIILFLKYIDITKKKADPLFILALIALLCINFFSFYSFKDYFVLITLLTSSYLLLFTFILKKYLNKSKLKSVLSLSVILGFLLVGYVIFAVVELLIGHIPDYNLFYVFLCALCLFVYSITFAVIYINDNYENGTTLLASGVFSIFHIGLSPINEYYYFNETFTVLIIICHFLSIYLFISFITKAEIIDPKDAKEKYV